MKIITIVRVILIILILANFITTFGFSSQEGTESSGLSRGVTLFVLNVFGEYDEPLDEEQEELVSKAEHVIREIAHFSIYTLLGILLMGLANTYEFSNKKRVILSIVIGILYASLDEFHQSFVPGRAALLTDVLIDTMGTITGIVIVFLLINIYRKRKLQKEDVK